MCVPGTGPVVAQRLGGGIALLFMTTALEGGEWSAARPGRTLPPGKTWYPLYRRLVVQEAGWAPGPVWTGGKSRPTGIRSPDRSARSQSLYRLSYLAHYAFRLVNRNFKVNSR